MTKLKTKENQEKLTRPSSIVALCIISESEIKRVLPDYDFSMEDKNATKFKLMLHSIGMDISIPYIRQDGIQHRNRFNEVVICSRWVGNERTDEQWINSGYASKAAIDKASGSKLTEDIYRSRYETEDAQAYLESRDKYAKQTED